MNNTPCKILLMFIFCTAFFYCKKKTSDDIIYQTYPAENPKGKSDTMYYDLNNDSEMDIVAIRNTEYLAGGGQNLAGKIYSLKSPMLFTFLRTDPQYKMLDTTDFIRNSWNYEWIDTLAYTSFSGHSWQGVFTPNFGFQINIGGRHFGWFHLVLGRIAEIGFNRTPNKGIQMGQKK